MKKQKQSLSHLLLPQLHRLHVRQRQAERHPSPDAGRALAGSGVDPLCREREVAVGAQGERSPGSTPGRRRHLLDLRGVPGRGGERLQGLQGGRGEAHELRRGRGAGGGRAAVGSGGSASGSGSGSSGSLAADSERPPSRRLRPRKRGDLGSGDLDRGAGTAAAAAPGLSPDDAGGSAAEDAVGLRTREFFGGGRRGGRRRVRERRRRRRRRGGSIE